MTNNVANYELCEKCEKAMTEAGVVGLTVEEMIEQKAQFDGGTAIIFLKEGLKVKRISNDRIYALKEDSFGSCKEEDKKTLIATVDETGKTTAYWTLSTDDLLAEDWIIVG